MRAASSEMSRFLPNKPAIDPSGAKCSLFSESMLIIPALMKLSFSEYLLSKQTVDERALNQHVYETFKSVLSMNLPPGRNSPLKIIEVGAGIGTMPVRLLRRGLLTHADYIAVDEMPGNIACALDWIPQWAAQSGLAVERPAARQLRLFDQDRELRLTFEQADVFDFIK